MMYLSHMFHAISNKKLSISDLIACSEVENSEGMIFEKMMGLKWISRTPGLTVTIQLSYLLDLIKDNGIFESATIKYIFFAHTADFVAPANVNILENIKKKYSLKPKLCFASSLYKCATAFHFIKMSRLLLKNLNIRDHILILIADTCYTKILKKIPGSTIMGDGASALILTKQASHHQIIDIIVDTDGRFSSLFPEKEEQLLFQSIYSNKLNFLIHAIIKKNNISLSEIAIIFPHNVNLISWKNIMKNLSLPIEKIYLQNISKIGHCFGSDPFINLQDAITEKIIKPSDYYLMITVGLGATFAVALMRY